MANIRERSLIRKAAGPGIRALYRSIIKSNVPADWRAGTDPSQLFTRQCYDKAAEFMMRVAWTIEGAQLVHGVYCVAGFPSKHAWVELPGDVVFDGVIQDFFDRADYYEKVKAKPVRTYNRTAAAQQFDVETNAGPWHPAREDSAAMMAYFDLSVGVDHAE